MDMNQRIDWQGWLKSVQGVAWLAFALGLVGLMVQSDLLVIWSQSEEYGHGLMVVAVLAYLVARRWGFYRPVGPGHGAASLLLAILSLCLVVLGEASGIALMGYYGIWLFGLAAVWAAGGIGFVRKLAVPFLIVPLLFPLPNPLGPLLTAELQLISSKLGVWLIRLFGGSVYLEGNVLDMGQAYKLLVAEACAGLRYLFPLMSLGAIAGFVLRVPLWMRWTVFLVTIPITIFMNSFRIAVTGLLSESGGTVHTDGFLHLFEGWVVFIAASLLLLAVTSVLVKLLPGKQRLFDVLALQDEAAVSASSAAGVAYRTPVTMIWVITGLMLAAAAGAGALAVRDERMPERSSLNAFPLQIREVEQRGWVACLWRWRMWPARRNISMATIRPTAPGW